MLVLVTAGAVATGLAFPVALAIGALLAILILSYRQTITAYPSAGGAYVVSRDNFGPRWALVAGSALLIDYVLTVAVSVTSGVAALTTALPSLQRFVLPLSLAAIGRPTSANLRGERESGRILAVPTYLFVCSCAVMLMVGLGRLATGHLDPMPASGTAPLPQATALLGVLLVLHAFAAGCTALTGVEAISNGVPAFRPPEARNARRTLVAMGLILGSLFVGVSYLAVRVGVRPFEDGNPTLIGQVARWVLGGSVAGHAFFYLFQAATLGHPGAGRQHVLRRLPAAGVVRGRRRLPAQVVHQAWPAAGALQRHPCPVGGGRGRHPYLPGRLQPHAAPVRHRGVHLLHLLPGGHDPTAPAPARAGVALRDRRQRSRRAGHLPGAAGHHRDQVRRRGLDGAADPAAAGAAAGPHQPRLCLGTRGAVGGGARAPGATQAPPRGPGAGRRAGPVRCSMPCSTRAS